MSGPIVTDLNEPSQAAWKRAGEIAARILEGLAIRDAEEEARQAA